MRTMLKPHNRKKYRTSGFRARMSTKRGRGVISRRRRKGRRRLTISDEK